MKRIIKITFIAAAIAVSAGLYAQTPPPPNGGNGAPTGGNTPVGGGAPIGSGLAVLLLAGAAYGSSKVFQFYYHKNNE